MTEFLKTKIEKTRLRNMKKINAIKPKKEKFTRTIKMVKN